MKAAFSQHMASRSQSDHRRKKRQPEVAAGKLAIAMGVGGLAMALFASTKPASRITLAAYAFLGLTWGLKELAAAKKWKQQPEEDYFAKTARERRESENFERVAKSGSMENVVTLFEWVWWVIFAAVTAGLALYFFRHGI